MKKQKPIFEISSNANSIFVRGKTAYISGCFTLLAALLSGIISILTNIATDKILNISIPKEYISVLVIIASLALIIPFFLRLAFNYYRKKTLQTETTIQRLKEKNAELLKEIDLQLSTLINKKVH